MSYYKKYLKYKEKYITLSKLMKGGSSASGKILNDYIHSNETNNIFLLKDNSALDANNINGIYEILEDIKECKETIKSLTDKSRDEILDKSIDEDRNIYSINNIFIKFKFEDKTTENRGLASIINDKQDDKKIATISNINEINSDLNSLYDLLYAMYEKLYKSNLDKIYEQYKELMDGLLTNMDEKDKLTILSLLTSMDEKDKLTILSLLTSMDKEHKNKFLNLLTNMDKKYIIPLCNFLSSANENIQSIVNFIYDSEIYDRKIIYDILLNKQMKHYELIKKILEHINKSNPKKNDEDKDEDEDEDD